LGYQTREIAGPVLPGARPCSTARIRYPSRPAQRWARLQRKVVHPIGLALGLTGRFRRFGCGGFGRRLQFADWLSTPDVLVLESHGDRRIRALLDAHHGFTHSCSNAPAVDLIELAVPWDGVVIGHLPLFDVAQRRRQIVLFTQRSMGVLHSGRFHRQGRIPSWPSSRPPAGLARPGSSAAVLRPPSRLDPVNRTFLLCPNRTLLLCRDNRI